MALLWRPDIVCYYLRILNEAKNPEMLDAAAGAIHNLAASYREPSVKIRREVRHANGLSIFVKLLRRTKDDRVVWTVVDALLNLSLDPKNSKFIGK